MEEQELLLSLDVVSLDTMIPIDEAIKVIKDLTDQKTARLVDYALDAPFSASKENSTNKHVGWLWAHHSPQSLPTCSWRILNKKL